MKSDHVEGDIFDVGRHDLFASVDGHGHGGVGKEREREREREKGEGRRGVGVTPPNASPSGWWGSPWSKEKEKEGDGNGDEDEDDAGGLGERRPWKNVEKRKKTIPEEHLENYLRTRDVSLAEFRFLLLPFPFLFSLFSFIFILFYSFGFFFFFFFRVSCVFLRVISRSLLGLAATAAAALFPSPCRYPLLVKQPESSRSTLPGYPSPFPLFPFDPSTFAFCIAVHFFFWNSGPHFSGANPLPSPRNQRASRTKLLLPPPQDNLRKRNFSWHSAPARVFTWEGGGTPYATKVIQ